MRNAQRGNILFLILLAVVLFAALSYAVTSSTQGGGKNASDEKAQSTVAEMMNYFALMDAAVQRMMLTGGVKDYELNFYTITRWTVGSNDNTNCTEDRCKVFHPSGGAVAGKNMPVERGTGNPIQGRILYISLPGVGSDKPDIVYALYAVSTAVCLEVNKRIGINDMIYNVNIGEGNTTLMYWNPVPIGPIPDTTSTGTGLPPHIGSTGTFCTCHQATLANCEAGHTPKVIHVLVTR